MSQQPRERRFEKINSKGELVEIIEETLPGRIEAFGQMLLRTENHNLYESGTKTLPGEKRYKEILKQKKEEEKLKCICGYDDHSKCICDHDKICICGHDEGCICGLEEEIKKKKLEEKRKRKLEEEKLKRENRGFPKNDGKRFQEIY